MEKEEKKKEKDRKKINSQIQNIGQGRSSDALAQHSIHLKEKTYKNQYIDFYLFLIFPTLTLSLQGYT